MTETPENSSPLKPWHPLFVAAFPVLSLYSNNLHEASIGDVFAPLAASIVFALILWGVTRLAFRDWQRAAVATSFLMVFFLGQGYIYYAATRASRAIGGPDTLPNEAVMVPILFVVLAGLIGLRAWRYDARMATGALNTFGFLFVTVSLVAIGFNSFNKQDPAENPGEIAEYLATEPIQLQMPTDAPDVYYLVFDRYGSKQTLQEHFDFDNKEFYSELRKRGFHIAEDSCANYPKTVISMASALNLRYHDQRMLKPAVYADEVRYNRAARLLKDVGYRYLFLGNWHGPFRSSPLADEKYNICLLPSEFADSFYATTPLESFMPMKANPRVVQKKLEIFHDMVPSPGPKFVHAHWLLPHPPLRFNRDGSLASEEQLASQSRREKFVNQVVFTNKEILKMIDKIQSTSKVPPVIVLQADEGPYLYDDDQDREEVAKIKIRTRILSAFCLPGVDAQKVVAKDITPVNTFRLIFREYFAADIDLLKNRTYWWERSKENGLPEYLGENSFVESTHTMQGVPSPAKVEHLGGL